MKEFLQKKNVIPILILIGASLIACFGLPLLSTYLGVSKVRRIIWLFLVIDPLLVISSAVYYKRHQLSIFWLLLFPFVFALSIWWRFAKYNYWLVGVYLVLGILIYCLVPQKGKQMQTVNSHHIKQ